MDKPLVEKEEDKTTSKRNRVAKSAREATKCTKKDGKLKEDEVK
jgi:hypothetical protein